MDEKLREVCLEIEKRYEIKLLEIGNERGHVHFLVQSVPTEASARIVQKTKSITARKIFEACPEVKKQLWGGAFWTRGYYVGTVGEHGDETEIAEYVKNQGREPAKYKKLYNDRQMSLSD